MCPYVLDEYGTLVLSSSGYQLKILVATKAATKYCGNYKTRSIKRTFCRHATTKIVKKLYRLEKLWFGKEEMHGQTWGSYFLVCSIVCWKGAVVTFRLN